MIRQKQECTHVRKGDVICIFRTLLFILLALLLGVKLYAWNAKSLVRNSLPMPFGYGASVVLSGSMEPVLSVNDLVLLKETQDVEIGDVIVYESGGELIIHRVQAVDGDTITTKGDANDIADEPFDRSCVRGKMIAVFPAVGGLVRILKTPTGTIVLLAAAFFLIELSYRSERRQDDDETEAIKAEIRRLKENKYGKISKGGDTLNGDTEEI